MTNSYGWRGQDVPFQKPDDTIRIAFVETELQRLGAVKLVPGMPVETFVQTDERTVLSYLLKPVDDQVARAFRER